MLSKCLLKHPELPIYYILTAGYQGVTPNGTSSDLLTLYIALLTLV